MVIQNKRLTVLLFLAMLLMLVPLLTMQFTDQVNWSFSDFLVMGFLLFITILTCELVLRKIKRTWHRVILLLATAAVFLLVWVELAVGIFGTTFAGS